VLLEHYEVVRSVHGVAETKVYSQAFELVAYLVAYSVSSKVEQKVLFAAVKWAGEWVA
jgi:hypothetical protein